MNLLLMKLKLLKADIKMPHELPALPFEIDALDPYMNSQTMKLHHGKHHAAYVAKLNAVLEKYPELQEKKVEDLLKDLSSIPEDIRQAVINFGGGHLNHSFFWKTLTPKPTEASDKFSEAINTKFGSFDKFKEEFSKQSASFFGSGWTWLVVKDKELQIITTKNQDSPISNGFTPIMTLDLWEHSWYVQYLNEKPKYIEAFWNILNKEEISKRFEES